MDHDPNATDAARRAKSLLRRGEESTGMNGLAERLRELADWSTVGLFVLAAFAVMRSMSDLLAPMIAALIVGSLLSRIIDRLAKIGLPPPVSAIGLVALTGLIVVVFVDS